MLTKNDRTILTNHIRQYKILCANHFGYTGDNFQDYVLNATACAVSHATKAINSGKYTLSEVLGQYPLN
jgi:hypothetical protein